MTIGEELSLNLHGFCSHTTNRMWWVVVDVGQNECWGHIMHMKLIRELKQYLVNQAQGIMEDVRDQHKRLQPSSKTLTK